MRTVFKVVTSDKFNTENEFESSMELACCSSAELADKAIEWLTDDDGWDEDDLEIIIEGKDIPFDAVDIDGEIVKLEDEIDVVDLDTIYEINCEDEILARCSSERIAKEAMQKLIEDGGWYFGGVMTVCTDMTPVGVILFSTAGSLAGAVILYSVGRFLPDEVFRKLLLLSLYLKIE